MRFLSFNAFKHLLLKKTDVLKICGKSKFLGQKISRNARALKKKKVQGVFGKTFILASLSSAVFRLQPVSQISFKLFCLGDKRLLSGFLRQ